MRFSKSLGLFALAVFLSHLVFALLPARVQAETVSASFTDFSRINVSSITVSDADRDRLHNDLDDVTIASINNYLSQVVGEFVDRDIEDNYVATDNGVSVINHEDANEWVFNSSDGCESKIRRTTSGSYQFNEIRIFIPGRSCIDITGGDNWTITSLDKANENRWFNWKAANTMTRVDGVGGDWIELDKANQPGVYFRSDESGTNHQDNVRLNANDLTSGRLRISINDSDDKEINVTVGNPGARANPAVDPAAADEEDDNSCESHGGPLGWIVCPILNMMDGALNWLDSQIQGLLEVDQDKYTNQNLRLAWARIRNIAYIILIPIMLVMVIGTALGFEVFSAYTVKRALPRMVVAVIFITFSWYITGFLIGLSNVVGGGVLGLMTQPFGAGGDVNLNTLFAGDTGGGGVVITGATATLSALVALIVVPGGLGILASLLFTAVLFLLVAFLVLVMRQMFVIVLMLVAPLAILAWIFPGNDSLWKSWWSVFSKLLLMFPLIMAIIAVGRIFATILDETGGGGVDGAVLNPILKLSAYVIPYIFIPFTFKFAGGLFANLAGVVNDRGKGLFDRAKGYRQQKMPEFKQNAKAGSARFGLGKPISGIAAGPKGWTRKGGIRASRETAMTMGGAELFENNAVAKANQNNDQFLLAVANKKMAQDKLNEAIAGGDETDIAAWRQAIGLARQINDTPVNRLAAGQRLAGTGYQFDAGQAGYNQLAETIASATGVKLERDSAGNVVGASGANAGIYANAMNGAQYAEKNAGRFDLAGINNGTGYDAKAGLDKADPYTIGRSKKQTASTMGNFAQQQVASGNHEAASVLKQELQSLAQSSTGAVRDEALLQHAILSGDANFINNALSRPKDATKRTAALAAMAASAPALEAWERTPTGGTTQRRENYDSVKASTDPAYAATWSDPVEQARGWRTVQRPETNADIASRKARISRIPREDE